MYIMTIIVMHQTCLYCSQSPVGQAKDSHVDQWPRTESQGEDPHTHSQTISDKGLMNRQSKNSLQDM